MNRYNLSNIEIEAILAMARNNLVPQHAANELYLHRNTVLYRLGKAQERTGLNPRKFLDLVQLLRTVAPELVEPNEDLTEAGKFVAGRMLSAEVLTQLAEEAAELAQAALKLRRTITPHNPTPVTEEEALACLKEELADVQNCAELVRNSFGIQQALVDDRAHEKMERWAKRLKGEEHGSLSEQN